MPKDNKKNPNYEAWKKQRNDWGNVKPYTQVHESKKYKKKVKHKGKEYDDGE